MPSVSIAISSYNQLHFLKEALNSVTSQEGRYDEILVIDDCSTDGSPEYLHAWEKQDSNRRVIQLSRNMGRGNNRNVALREADGDYLAFLDGDDWLEAGSLKRVRNVLEVSSPDLIVCRTNMYLESEKRFIPSGHANPYYQTSVFGLGRLQTADERAHLFKVVPAGWQKVHRLQLLRENNIHCTIETYEDILWHHQVIVQSSDVICLDTPMVNYRQHGQSILNSVGKIHFTMFEVVDACSKYMLSSPRATDSLINGSRAFLFNVVAFSVLHTHRIPSELKSSYANEILKRGYLLEFPMNDREMQMLQAVRELAAVSAKSVQV